MIERLFMIVMIFIACNFLKIIVLAKVEGWENMGEIKGGKERRIKL